MVIFRGCNIYFVSPFAKRVICKIWVVLQQLSSHICLAKLILLLPSVAAQARLEQNSKKESISPNKCVRKVVEELNKSQYFQFADKPFCQTTEDLPEVQSASSLASVQSVSLSHLHVIGRHLRLSTHWNCSSKSQTPAAASKITEKHQIQH